MIDPTFILIAGIAYHLACLVKDGETVVANVKTYRNNPTIGNLLRLTLAEGVFVADFGLPK